MTWLWGLGREVNIWKPDIGCWFQRELPLNCNFLYASPNVPSPWIWALCDLTLPMAVATWWCANACLGLRKVLQILLLWCCNPWAYHVRNPTSLLERQPGEAPEEAPRLCIDTFQQTSLPGVPDKLPERWRNRPECSRPAEPLQRAAASASIMLRKNCRVEPSQPTEPWERTKLLFQ